MIFLSDTKPILFVSDIHLSENQPEISSHFFDFLTGPAQEAGHLFILGDLFNAWLGDDCLSNTAQQLISHLENLHNKNINIYFMAGNRDYLLGQHYAKLAHLKLIPDPSIILINNIPVLLTHGDQLVTLDKAYQQYRKIAQHPFIINNFPKLPKKWRAQFGEFLRKKSKQNTQQKPKNYLDVEEKTVLSWLEKYNTSTLIHGHVHKLKQHNHIISTGPAQRWVLGDWHGSTGNYLSYNNYQFELINY